MSAVNLEQLAGRSSRSSARRSKGRDIAWKIGRFRSATGTGSMLKMALVNLLSNAVKFTRIRDTGRNRDWLRE